jgi:2-desacetyl-2-hydroxyethyl bacteriochlorophyllide A dehydrogenase
MQVVMRRGGTLTCEEAPDPVPAAGQTLVKSLACGICGSDLHALHYATMAAKAVGASGAMGKPFVFGHEFCGEVIEHGRGGGRFKAGTRVVSMPFGAGPKGTETIGYSPNFPGGFAEQMLLTERLMLEVPNGLPTDIAALTEPMAVGAHGVARATSLTKDSVVLIIGMGPVGAAVLLNLKAKGIGPIIAADFSPRRRQLAEQLGADLVVDPAKESPHERWESFGVPLQAADPLAAILAGHERKHAVIFECVGNPGVLQGLIAGAPFGSEIVVLGVCLEPDQLTTGQAVTKELTIRTGVFYTADEFAGSLHNLAEGIIDGRPLITDRVGLTGVADAFERLKNPEAQVKIIVEPSRR